MRSVTLILILVVVAMTKAAPASEKPHYDLKNADALFEKFIVDYNRNYTDAADRDAHYRAFVTTLGEINKLNAEDNGATFDINKFADYTEEEKKNLFGFNHPEIR